MNVLEDTPAVLSLGKLCDEHRYSYKWITGQKPHLIKNGIRIQCNTENFVPIVVPGLSTSSSSSLLSSTSMTPLRQEIDHPTSSSSSSTSPTMTSSTVSSESVARQERRDPCGIDHYPAAVSSKHVERQERETRALLKSQKSTKVMDIVSRLPGCAGQAADAVSAFTQVKMEDAPKLLKIPKSECPDIWIRLPRLKWLKSWSSMEDPVVSLERNLYGHPLAGLL